MLSFWFLVREHFECKVLVLNICIWKGQSLFVFVKVVDHNGNGTLNIHEPICRFARNAAGKCCYWQQLLAKKIVISFVQ